MIWMRMIFPSNSVKPVENKETSKSNELFSYLFIHFYNILISPMNEYLKLSLYKRKKSNIKIVIKTSTYKFKEAIYNYHDRESTMFVK